MSTPARGPRFKPIEIIEEIRGSYWFVPSLIAFGGIVAGVGLTLIDLYLPTGEWLNGAGWLAAVQPEGARQTLSTIASSTITVAGVVFSITLAAVTFASGKYGARLLTSFAHDRGNQVTLGVFLATFLYCLVVLRAVHGSDEPDGATFVPQLALFGGLALAIASTGVLIYFVHHVTLGVHINSVIANIGQGMIVHAGCQASDRWAEPGPPIRGQQLCASEHGYLTRIDVEALQKLAERRGFRVRLLVRPGDFIRNGVPLAEIDGPADDDLRAAFYRAFAMGELRTGTQDVSFPIEQLVEIAVRALSPSSNDVFTAASCIDWLAAGLDAIREHRPLETWAACSRLTGPARSFDDFVELAFGRLRAYAVEDALVCGHGVAALDALARDAADDPKARRALETEAARWRSGAGVAGEPSASVASRG